MLLPSLVNFGMGLFQKSQADKRLSDLEKQPYSSFEPSPELTNAYNRAEQNAQTGFSPQERAAFVQKLAQQQSAAYRKATDMSGGSLASALNKGIQAQNIGAQTDFATNDATLKRRNITYADSLARAMQSQHNMQTQAENHRRLLEEQYLGTAGSQGMTNMANAVGGAGSLLFAQNAWDKYYGNSSNPAAPASGATSRVAMPTQATPTWTSM
jgi:hypothetical protein